MITISDFENSLIKDEPARDNFVSSVKFYASICFDKQNRATFSFMSENNYF